jgi:hypothetical protein
MVAITKGSSERWRIGLIITIFITFDKGWLKESSAHATVKKFPQPFLYVSLSPSDNHAEAWFNLPAENKSLKRSDSNLYCQTSPPSSGCDVKRQKCSRHGI